LINKIRIDKCAEQPDTCEDWLTDFTDWHRLLSIYPWKSVQPVSNNIASHSKLISQRWDHLLYSRPNRKEVRHLLPKRITERIS